MYQIINYPLCGKEVDNQEHALTCEEIAQHPAHEENQFLSSVCYSDLFGSLDRQAEICIIFRRIISIRQKINKEQGLPWPYS